MEKPLKTFGWCRFYSRRTLILISLAILVIALGLGLGLGLGITRMQNNGSNSGSQNSTIPTVNPPVNGSFWQPNGNSSWQIVLENPIDLSSSATSISPNVDVFDIDLFTNPETVLQTLHQLGKKVICYFSAGSYEPNRPDSSQFHSSDMGSGVSGWPGERWLNLSSANVRSIMAARIQLASQKGCDAIDPDNLDGYVSKFLLYPTFNPSKQTRMLTSTQQNSNGLGLSENDSITFMNFLSSTAHGYNLSIGLKNSLDILPSLSGQVQFAVNEQCVQYSECSSYASMIQDGKPVFHIEYASKDMQGTDTASKSELSSDCSDSGLNTVLKNQNLDGWVEYCNGDTATTPEVSN